MTVSEDTAIVELIKEKYAEIFMAEKKVADFILENPEQAVNANVSELANLSGVSDATVIRFCKRLGYQGYYQLRINLSRDLGRKMGGVEEEENQKNTIAGVFQNYARQMVEAGQNITDEAMQLCVNLIKSAGYVHLVAVGNTSPLVQYMGFRLGRLGIRCTYNNLPEYFLNQINLAKKGDVVFAISQSGSSKQVVQAMELAREKGLKIIAITGYQYSPVSRLADCLLLSSAQEESFDYYKSYSHLRETAVIDAVLYFVTNEELIEKNLANKPEILLSEYKL